MGKIQLLDNTTIQKIAAGEVIERPSSIIKELIENSLDANSKNIVVEINEGGKSYIRVTDDGDGIEEEDLPLAFERHSTSKLKKIDDLNSIYTLGFRGEALASVAAVAKVEVLSKTKESSAGIHAKIEEGVIKSMEKVGSPKGTTMIVKDLFYNLPVRKKFLKSDISEGNAISDMVNKLALGNYNSSFKLIRDNKVILKTSNNGDVKENIYSILGKDIVSGLIPVEYQGAGISIKGYISNNSVYRSNRSHEYLYINGRYIVNYGIASAIEHHYKSIIPLNRFPVFVLYIDMDPADMDVNIHPTKQEVKFSQNKSVVGIISNVIKDVLFPSINIPKFKVKEEVKKEELPNLFNLDELQKGVFSNDLSSNTSFKESNISIRDYSTIDLSRNDDIPNEDGLITLEDDYFRKITNDKNYPTVEIKENLQEYDNEENKIENPIPYIVPLGIVFDTYIIGENKTTKTIYFIDQHAAHERILYEKYRNEYNNESIVIQQLIAPEIIELTNSEYNLLNENLDYFKSLGFDLEEFDSSSYALRGVPFLFGKPNARLLLLDLLDNLDKDLKSSYDTRLDKLMKLACSSAIKGGDKISSIEINALLKDLSRCDNPLSCPHGRPTIIEISKTEIEKQFLRIV